MAAMPDAELCRWPAEIQEAVRRLRRRIREGVTLRVLQEVSNVIKGGADVYLPISTGFTEEPIDIVNSQSVSGTVVGVDVDGLTIAIGGLIQENVTDSRAGFFFR
jgi:type II secretory pathway component GspD/PulD (secretin)